MGLFTPRPLCPQAQLAEDELKKDLAGAKAFGAVRLGEKALYLPGIPARRYVPLPWVQRVWLRMMEASVQGEFIQPLLVVTYPGGQVQIEAEHRREVDQLLEALKAQPGLPLGREYPALPADDGKCGLHGGPAGPGAVARRANGGGAVRPGQQRRRRLCGGPLAGQCGPCGAHLPAGG